MRAARGPSDRSRDGFSGVNGTYPLSLYGHDARAKIVPDVIDAHRSGPSDHTKQDRLKTSGLLTITQSRIGSLCHSRAVELFDEDHAVQTFHLACSLSSPSSPPIEREGQKTSRRTSSIRGALRSSESSR